MNESKNRPWDPASDQRLAMLWHDKNVSVRAIADELGRSDNAIRMRAKNVLALGERGASSDQPSGAQTASSTPDQVFMAIRPPATFNVREPDTMDIAERIKRDRVVAQYLRENQACSESDVLDWWESRDSALSPSEKSARPMKGGDLFRAFVGWYVGEPLPFYAHSEDWPWFESLFGPRPLNAPSLVRDQKGRRIPWA